MRVMIVSALTLLRAFGRDRAVVALAFVAPLTFFSLLGLFYRHLDAPEGMRFRIAIVSPQSGASEPLVAALVARSGGRLDVRRADRSTERDGVITIDDAFDAHSPAVNIESLAPLPGIGDALRQLVAAASADAFAADNPCVMVTDSTVEGRLLRRNAAAIPVMFILFALSSLAGRGMGDDETGLAERLRSLGISRSRRTFARVIAMATIAAVQMGMTLAFAILVFGVTPISPLGLVAASLASAVACASFVVALTECCATRARFAAVAPVVTLAFAGLGGSMIPVEMLPRSLAWPSQWMFTGWSIRACGAALDGKPWLGSVALLLGFTVVMLVVASAAGRRSPFR